MTIETELPAVKVKALEWTHEDDGEYIAYSEIGWYHIGRPASFWNLTVPCGEVPSFETLEAAQAAAQQDYSARILSALTLKDDPGNGGGGEAERLREALEEALVVLDTYADPTGYTDGYGDLLPADAEQHEGLLAREAAEKIRSALSQYRKGSEADG